MAALATLEGAVLKATWAGRDIFGHHARLALGTARTLDREQFGVWSTHDDHAEAVSGSKG